MTEEKLKKYLSERSQTQGTPFKVPEGYFDTLCDRVMAQIPAEKKQKTARHFRLVPRVWQSAVAVVVLALVVGGSFLLPRSEKEEQTKQPQTALQQTTAAEAENSYQDEAYMNEALDYAMVDNEEIEAYLTE